MGSFAKFWRIRFLFPKIESLLKMLQNAANTQLSSRYKRVFFFQDRDAELVRQAGKAIEKDRTAAMNEWFAWMEMQNNLVFSDALMDAVSESEQEIWADLTMAQIDDDSVRRQRGFGRIMQDFGVDFDTYLSMLVALHEIIENVYRRKGLGNFDLIRAFKKVAGINICIVIDIYNEAINHTLREQHAALMELSSPITRLWDKILFLPLVGVMDSRRSQEVMKNMLQKIAETQSRVFVLDISGIAVMDTAIANQLVKMTKAVRLMGCRCIVSGISPTVAQTLVELGIQTEEMHTQNNLQGALQDAFANIGKRLVDAN